MRLYVAAYPPEDVSAHLATIVDRLAVGRAAENGVNARLAPRANWHLTLAFLGEVPDQRAPEVPDVLAGAVARWRAANGEPPQLWLAGGGRFGRGRFTVLWVGVGGHVDGLKALSTAVRKGLKGARLPYDPKPMRPHLTLARPGDRIDVRDDVIALEGYQGPQWTVRELQLMRSHLGPKPTYDRLADVPLSA